VDEALILQTAQQMKDLGLLAAGYNWINLDDCYASKNRSASGEIVAGKMPLTFHILFRANQQRVDPVKWPSGMTSLTTRVKKLGLYVYVRSLLSRWLTSSRPNSKMGIVRPIPGVLSLRLTSHVVV
jgi:hypothetical protein